MFFTHRVWELSCAYIFFSGCLLGYGWGKLGYMLCVMWTYHGRQEIVIS